MEVRTLTLLGFDLFRDKTREVLHSLDSMTLPFNH